MDIAISTNKIPIRLTQERWYHITIGHPEMAAYYDEILETVEQPDTVFLGVNDELLAVKQQQNEPEKFIVVIYKELDNVDGFITTSFITNKKPYFAKKEIIWKQ